MGDKLRKRLSAKIKNTRVRRMLQLDNIEDEYNMAPNQEEDDRKHQIPDHTLVPLKHDKKELVMPSHSTSCPNKDVGTSTTFYEEYARKRKLLLRDVEITPKRSKADLKSVPTTLSYKLKDVNHEEIIPEAVHSSCLAVTPSTSLIKFNEICTPDSFKRILNAVKNDLSTNCDSYSNNLRRVASVGKHDSIYKKYYFLASASTIYLKDDLEQMDRTMLASSNIEENTVLLPATNDRESLLPEIIDEFIIFPLGENDEEESTQLFSEEVGDAILPYCEDFETSVSCSVVSDKIAEFILIQNSENPIEIITNNEISINPTEILPTKPIKEISFIASQLTVYINDENFTENIKTPPKTKRNSRKRVRQEKTWKDYKNKILKNSGKRYHSKATNKVRNAKVMGDPCRCKNKCNEKIENNDRMSAFTSYWQLASHERQWDYILKYVKTKPTRTVLLNSKRPRTQTLIYSLPKRNGHEVVTVCKKMFLQTFNINDRTVFTALQKQESESVVDLRGCHNNRVKKINEDTSKSVFDHINLFPRKESHYLRKQTQREYLDEKLNCAKMHRLYLEWIKNTPGYENVTPATERWYYNIFNTKFNIGFFHPKKDLCDICTLYEQADNERKEQLKKEYEDHVNNKELVRKIKQEEKDRSNAEEKTIACFDLEKVLSLPQSEVGVFHYKRKYPVYNFTVYNILSKKGHCYVWHAQIAKRGANEIASCLWNFLQIEAEKEIKEVSFYSDNCTGQNRNRFVFALYIHACKTLNISITHRFLQKGHTQNEGDSMHSCIEKSKKNHVLYVPEEMYAVIRNAKVQGQKYNVKEMTQEDFFDFKKLITTNTNWEKDSSGAKINWTKVKEVSVKSQFPGILNIKYELDRSPLTLDTNRSIRARRKKLTDTETTDRPIELQKLYNAPLHISEKLYKDLISLCKDNHIPQHYQAFYKNLRPQNAITTDRTNSDDEEEEVEAE